MSTRTLPAWALLLALIAPPARAEVPVDLSAYRPDCGVDVRQSGDRLDVAWPLDARPAEFGRLSLALDGKSPLVASLGIGETAILKDVDPVVFMTVGSRENPPGRPPGMSTFNVFFDNPAKRPYKAHRSTLDLRSARVASKPGRATITLGDVAVGPFEGTLQITVYAGARLVHVEAVVSTTEERRAFVYDAGLVAAEPGWNQLAWVDVDGKLQQTSIRPDAPDAARAVHFRTLIAANDAGSVATFPPPHQFFYPRDYTDNQSTVWDGRGHRGLEQRAGFGVRQTETGGGNFVPWFNAPPGSDQRLGVFYLLTRGRPAEAIEEVKKLTHGDRYVDLPGRTTFTSHWHMEIALAALKEIDAGKPRTTPDLVKMFKDMNVRIVHLAEFHSEGHSRDPGPIRLREMEAMFAECKRLSDDRLTLLPGEEANAHLGISRPGQHPGHWLYLFPRPVYWTLVRGKDQPFVEDDPKVGRLYHVGNAEEMARLIDAEKGLAWTAHPRIKASNWAPDAYRSEPYYLSPNWLGGAWKAMPADLSSPRLGRRVLDLLDDMANWGPHKYVPGEVDVFTIDHTHELYGHMNINYLQLDRAPRYEDDWTPVLDALRRGRFFVTTGEVLLTEFAVCGQGSGQSLRLPDDGRPELKVSLDWTFPMNFAEVISGDGERVYRERVDLTDSRAFGKRTLTLRPDLSGRKWVRVEAWDVAANGAFSQPVWLEPASR